LLYNKDKQCPLQKPFHCSTGDGCYGYFDWCNFKSDCSDGSDEPPATCTLAWDIAARSLAQKYQNNQQQHCPEATPFACADGKACYSTDQFCNGNNECSDGSDEPWSDGQCLHWYDALSGGKLLDNDDKKRDVDDIYENMFGDKKRDVDDIYENMFGDKKRDMDDIYENMFGDKKRDMDDIYENMFGDKKRDVDDIYENIFGDKKRDIDDVFDFGDKKRMVERFGPKKRGMDNIYYYKNGRKHGR